MLYELRTYNLKPGSVPVYEAKFAESYPVREKYSRLGGFWHTDVGPLNQVLHIWPYESMEQRESVRAQAGKDPSGKWPPAGRDLILEMQEEILTPAPFMRPLAPSTTRGNVYELRIYTYQPGTIPQVLEKWADAIPLREKYSPLVGCWHSEQNKFFHLWVYKDLVERDRVRSAAVKDPSGKWPPGTTQWLIKQENKILVPTSYSPLG